MKNRFQYILLLALLFTACQKDIDEVTVVTNEKDPIVLVQTTIIGNVLDEDKIGIANTIVKAGQLSTITDSKGYFEFISTEIKKSEGILTAEVPGFFEGIAASNFTASGSSFVEIVMVNKGLPFNFDSESEGLLQTGDIEIQFPAGEFIDENEQKYQGEVETYSRYLDPTAEEFSSIMPGQLVSKSEEGEDQALSVYSMMALDLVSEDGEQLILKDGEEATVQMKIPDELVDNAPDEVILYLFDVEEQRWVKSGSCQKVGNYYNCTISGSGYYCCCVPLPSICLSAQIFNSDGTESCFIKVIIEDLTDNFIYYGFTNEEGFFCGSVPQAADLRMTVIDHCNNVVYMDDIGPYSMDHQLPDIYLESTVEEYIIKIQADLINCDGSEFTNGHIAITVPGKLTVFPIGDPFLDLNIAMKCVAFPSLDIQVYSEIEEAVSPVSNFIEFSDIDLDVVQPCDALDDFFRIEIDGVMYFTAPTQFYQKNNTTTNWYVFEGLSSNETFKLDLKNYNGEDTYVANAIFNLNVSPFSTTPKISTSSPDIVVNITLDDGNYIEGNFSGTGYDILNQQRVINSTFRIKKAP